jgi:hypothetical protein
VAKSGLTEIECDDVGDRDNWLKHLKIVTKAV